MKKSIILYAAIAALALFAAIALQAVQSVAFSQDFHRYEQDKIFTAPQMGMEKEDAEHNAMEIVKYLKNEDNEVHTLGLTDGEMAKLNEIRHTLRIMGIIKYSLVAVFLIISSIIVFLYKLKGLKTLGAVYAIGCVVVAIIIAVLNAFGVFRNLLLPMFSYDKGMLAVLFTPQFFVDCGYRLVRVCAVIAAVILTIALGVVFWRKPDDERDNYLYQ